MFSKELNETKLFFNNSFALSCKQPFQPDLIIESLSKRFRMRQDRLRGTNFYGGNPERTKVLRGKKGRKKSHPGSHFQSILEREMESDKFHAFKADAFVCGSGRSC